MTEHRDRYDALQALGMAHAKMPEKTPDMSSGIYNDYLYAAMLTELEANGFAIVKLPKPNKYDQWEIGKGPNHPVVYYDSGFDEIWYGSTAIDRQDSRAVAAALLAAANFADQVLS